MPTYNVNNWDYCTLTDAEVYESMVIPSLANGTLVSEVIDLTPKHTGLTALYINGHDIDVYYITNYSTDWTLVQATPLTEHILTTFDGVFCTGYDINYIKNLQRETDYRKGEELPQSNVVGFAKIDQSIIGGSSTTNTNSLIDNIFIENNYVKIYNTSMLPARTNISIVYVPTYPVLDGIGRYLVLKVIFKSMDSYLIDITIDFKLNTQLNVLAGVPTFYRRI